MSLESYWRQICPLTSTSLRSVTNASFSFDSCAASDALSTTTRPLLSSRRSSPDGSTTVAVSWSVRQRRLGPQQCVLNAAAPIVSNTCKYDGWVSSGDVRFTGWMPMTRFGSECVSRCTSVYTTWRLDTCRHTANQCPAFLVVITYARLIVVIWIFHMSIWLHMGDGRLPMLVPHLGTLYLTVSRTLILLRKPSNAISRPSSFPHTSTFSVFEVSYKKHTI